MRPKGLWRPKVQTEPAPNSAEDRQSAHHLEAEARGAEKHPRPAPGIPRAAILPARQTLARPRLGSRWPLPNAAAGGSEARDHLPTYPARGPEPTFATPGGSLGTRCLDVEVLSTSSESLFEIGPK